MKHRMLFLRPAIDQTVSAGAVAAPAQTGTNDGQFYKGCLRSGQVLETEGSIIVLGDVNPGGRIIAAAVSLSLAVCVATYLPEPAAMKTVLSLHWK